MDVYVLLPLPAVLPLQLAAVRSLASGLGGVLAVCSSQSEAAAALAAGLPVVGVRPAAGHFYADRCEAAGPEAWAAVRAAGRPAVLLRGDVLPVAGLSAGLLLEGAGEALHARADCGGVQGPPSWFWAAFGPFAQGTRRVACDGKPGPDGWLSAVPERWRSRAGYVPPGFAMIAGAELEGAGPAPGGIVQRFISARRRWRRAGKPTRTDEEVAGLLATCQQCEHGGGGGRRPVKRCRLCGCRVNQRNFLNKLRWATESCPASPPKW